MPLVTDIAKAVAAVINAAPAGTFGAEEFAAVQVYDPSLALQELSTLRVQVLPLARDTEQLSRAEMQTDVQVNICVRQRVDPDKQQRIDELLTLAERIDAYLRNTKTLVPSAGVTARWIASEHAPVYDGELLMAQHELRSFLAVTYRVMGAA